MYRWIIITEFYFRIVEQLFQNICPTKVAGSDRAEDPCVGILTSRLRNCPMDFMILLASLTISTVSYSRLTPGLLLEAPLLCWSHTSLALRAASP